MNYTFKNIIDMALSRVGESGTSDTDTLTIVKNAVNSGYTLIASTVDKKSSSKDYPLALKQKSVSLPNDFIDLIDVSHSIRKTLFKTEYEVVSDLLYIKTRDINGGTLTLTYSKYPEQLTGDNDTVNIKDGLIHALVAYAAYTFMLSKKKYSAAQLLLNEFNNFIGVGNVNISDYENMDNQDYTNKSQISSKKS